MCSIGVSTAGKMSCRSPDSRARDLIVEIAVARRSEGPAIASKLQHLADLVLVVSMATLCVVIGELPDRFPWTRLQIDPLRRVLSAVLHRLRELEAEIRSQPGHEQCR